MHRYMRIVLHKQKCEAVEVDGVIHHVYIHSPYLEFSQGLDREYEQRIQSFHLVQDGVENVMWHYSIAQVKTRIKIVTIVKQTLPHEL